MAFCLKSNGHMNSVLQVRKKIKCRKSRKKRGYQLQLTDLPWEDIVFTHILPFLSIKDLCRLQAVSQKYRLLYCAYLKQCNKLDFSSLHLTADAFFMITQHCENLRWLSITDCALITDSALCSVFQGNPLLNYIYMNSCPKLTERVLQVCAVYCKSLLGLWMNENSWLHSTGLEVVMFNMQKLQYLDISHCWEICQDTLLQLVLCIPSIIEFGLSKVEAVNDNVLGCISNHCKKLQTLRIKGCWRVTDVGIQKVIEWCPELKLLDIRGCQNMSLKYMCSMHWNKVSVLADYSMAELVKRRKLYYIGINIQI